MMGKALVLVLVLAALGAGCGVIIPPEDPVATPEPDCSQAWAPRAGRRWPS
jgi:hypothetical protein